MNDPVAHYRPTGDMADPDQAVTLGVAPSHGEVVVLTHDPDPDAPPLAMWRMSPAHARNLAARVHAAAEPEHVDPLLRLVELEDQLTAYAASLEGFVRDGVDIADDLRRIIGGEARPVEGVVVDPA